MVVQLRLVEFLKSKDLSSSNLGLGSLGQHCLQLLVVVIGELAWLGHIDCELKIEIAVTHGILEERESLALYPLGIAIADDLSLC